MLFRFTTTWFAAVAPVATPAPVLAALRTAFSTAIGNTGYVADLDRQSTMMVRMSPEAADTMLARERRIWSEAIRNTGASAE